MKLVFGCAAVLLLAGEIVSMPVAEREAFMESARLLVGGQRLVQVPAPVARAPPPQAEVSRQVALRTEAIAPDRFGQFQTTIDVEGQRLPVVVDTGASFLSLSFEDAGRLGLRPMPSDFKYKTSTANGIALSALAELRDVRLGSIEVSDVPVLIGARGALTQNLLGMSFLKKLSGFRVEDGNLVLQQ